MSRKTYLGEDVRSTTVLCVQKADQMVLAADGQITVGGTVLKSSAKKVRTLYKGKVMAGFAGATADALTLFELFEVKLEKYSGDLVRSAVELAKDWRTDRNLRRLEAMMIVADKSKQLILTGIGDVIEPDDGVSAIGSGGPYARSAALALLKHSSLSAEEIVREAMRIAGEICIYTNQNTVIERLGNTQ